MSIIALERTEIGHVDGGGGEPVVMLHCTASCGAQWRDLTGRFQGRHRVVTPDLWGHGRTRPWPGERPLTMADEVALVDAVAARLSTPFHLVGHSYGGAVALRYALDHRWKLSSLTLIEPVAFHVLRQGGLADQLLFGEIGSVALAVADARASGDHRRGLACFVDYWNGPGSWARLPPDRQVALCGHIRTIALDFAAVMTEPTPLRAYAEIDLPTLILSGDQSPATTRRIAESLGLVLPAARARTIAGAGHMAPLSHGEAIARAIEGLIDATGPVPEALAAA
jgi:pimeloyl-ACP methyl ester carboxylesterase